MTRKTALNTVIVLLTAILGVLGYKLSPIFQPTSGFTLPPSLCNPGLQTCTAKLPDGGEVEFQIEPRPIRPLQTLRLSAAITGFKVRNLEVDFAGATMEMGYNRPRLEESHGRFTGQTILPVCVSDKMDWIATILITTEKGQTIAIPFHFELTGR